MARREMEFVSEITAMSGWWKQGFSGHVRCSNVDEKYRDWAVMHNVGFITVCLKPIEFL
jgi:hypothetical protein